MEKIIDQLTNSPTGLLATAIIGVASLILIFLILRWVFSGILNIAFLVVGAALLFGVWYGFFGPKPNEKVSFGCLAGLVVVTLIGRVMRKSKNSKGS